MCVGGERFGYRLKKKVNFTKMKKKNGKIYVRPEKNTNAAEAEKKYVSKTKKYKN